MSETKEEQNEQMKNCVIITPKEQNEQGKKCFIITPIGNDNSEIFRKAKGVIDSVIKPVLQRNGFDDIKPAYEIMDSGMIGNQIINRIMNDDLVVTNLTGNNPNVMYELAVRHASAKPIIHICENGTTLPFDIKDSRTIFYTDDMLGVQELQSNFELFVKNIDYSKDYMDNPIYSGIRTGTIFKKMHDEGQQNEVEILQKILDKVAILPGMNNNEILKDSKLQVRNYIKIYVKYDDSKRINRFIQELGRMLGGMKYILNREVTINSCKIDICVDVDNDDVLDMIYQLASKYSIEIQNIVSTKMQT